MLESRSLKVLILLVWGLATHVVGQEPAPRSIHSEKRAALTRYNQERLRFSDKSWYRYLAEHRKQTVPNFSENNPELNQDVSLLRQRFIRQNVVEALAARQLTGETRVDELPHHLEVAIQEVVFRRRVYRGFVGSPSPRDLPKLATVTLLKGGNFEVGQGPLGQHPGFMEEYVHLRLPRKLMILAATKSTKRPVVAPSREMVDQYLAGDTSTSVAKAVKDKSPSIPTPKTTKKSSGQ